jgi:N utilization substance protein B
MAKITRKEARELLFALLFETEFRAGDAPSDIYGTACENREIPDDKYIKDTFFGVLTKSDFIDAVISKYAKGWRADRLSKVSRNVIRIAVYEMLFVPDIPANVSISQAVELSVKYGEDKAKQFVNGVLSGLFKDVEAKGVDGLIEETALEIASKKEETSAEEESDKSTEDENA